MQSGICGPTSPLETAASSGQERLVPWVQLLQGQPGCAQQAWDITGGWPGTFHRARLPTFLSRVRQGHCTSPDVWLMRGELTELPRLEQLLSCCGGRSPGGSPVASLGVTSPR